MYRAPFRYLPGAPNLLNPPLVTVFSGRKSLEIKKFFVVDPQKIKSVNIGQQI